MIGASQIRLIGPGFERAVVSEKMQQRRLFPPLVRDEVRLPPNLVEKIERPRAIAL